MSDERPEAAPELDVHEVEDGLVIYDLRSERVHYLNETASLVFVLCTGKHDVARIVELVGEAWKLLRPGLVARAEGLAFAAPRDDLLAARRGAVGLRRESLIGFGEAHIGR